MLHMIMCLEDVNSFIQNIESMAEKINFSLFQEFFGSLSPVDYAKELINTKNSDENKKKKKNVAEIKDRISDLKDRIKKLGKQKNK